MYLNRTLLYIDIMMVNKYSKLNKMILRFKIFKNDIIFMQNIYKHMMHDGQVQYSWMIIQH